MGIHDWTPGAKACGPAVPMAAAVEVLFGDLVRGRLSAARLVAPAMMLLVGLAYRRRC
jgi:hypothetical protein